MTRKEILNQLIEDTMVLVKKAMNDGNHEKVQMYVTMIADAQFAYWEMKQEV